MIRGIYTSASGMGVQQAKMDTISNNLANISVNGFKKDIVTQQSFADLLLIQQVRDAGEKVPAGWKVVGRTGQGAAVNGVVKDFSAGPVKQTGKPTDMTLQKDNCFFTVSDASNPGRVYYTRDGSFNIDKEGYLVNSLGHRIMGVNGPIWVYDDNFKVSPDGTISISEQAQKIRPNSSQSGPILKIVEFANPEELKNLKKEGDNYYTSDIIPRDARDPGLVQGFLEKSNVDLASEMANMIAVMRNYEANQKLIHAHDQLLDLAVNKVGSLK